MGKFAYALVAALINRTDIQSINRQKRVDHQREYAEALRRDMATPKVDSLGR